MRRRIFKWIKWLFWLGIFGCIAGMITFAGVYFYFSRGLPKIATLNDYQPPAITTFYSDNDQKIAEFYKERRIVIPLSKMSPMLIKAFLAAEDARFYEHGGIDIAGIIRAMFKNIEAGAIVQGGSTITQQVAKSFFLSPKRSFSRKIKEAILAYRIDNQFKKNEILYLYLNQIYLGNGAYGVEAAAENYFGKTAEQLNLAECAILGGLPRAPSRYAPTNSMKLAKERQLYVLHRMVVDGFITKEQATKAYNTPIKLQPNKNYFMDTVPYYSEQVRQLIEQKYGREMLFTGGLSVYTNVNIQMQKDAREAINTGLLALDKREGYRGPVKHIAKSEIDGFCQSLKKKQENFADGQIVEGVVIGVDNVENQVTVRLGDAMGILPLANMKWARKPDPDVPYGAVSVSHPGDVLTDGDVILVRLDKKNKKNGKWELSLEQQPDNQAALVCIQSGTGQVKVMVGGRDYQQSQFNRAEQSRRQPGSAFKPIIYAAAIDKGYTAATGIVDTPIVFQNSNTDKTWKPENYDNKFHGFTLFRDGLIHSMNVITVKILKDIGVNYVINYARKFGITAPLQPNLSLALGSSGVSPMELVTAYSVFDNQGEMIPPSFINKILDRNGNVIYQNTPTPKKVIDKSTAYIITHLMEEVVQYGTGWRVKALNRPVAGKTGTTNNLHDAWFVGFTPRYITGVWVGNDQEKSIGARETGSRAASPIWLDFMQQVLKGKPVLVFPVPENVVFAKIDAETGLLPISESKKTVFECFKDGTVPKNHTKRPGEITNTEDFFKKGIQ